MKRKSMMTMMLVAMAFAAQIAAGTTLEFTTLKMKGLDVSECSEFPAMRPAVMSSIAATEEVRQRLDVGYGIDFSPLPYTFQDGYEHETKRELDLPVAVLENKHLRAEFLVSLGGRLRRLYDKDEKRELITCNTEFRPGNLAIRNAWFAGGIEYNIGKRGHDAQTCSPRFTARLALPDGTPVLRFYEMSRDILTPFQLDFILPDDSRFLFLRARIANPVNCTTPLYWWSNLALDEPEGGRMIVPTDYTFATTYQSGGYALSRIEVPFGEGFDATFPKNFRPAKDHFYDIPDSVRRYQCLFDKKGKGFLFASTKLLRGRKLFVWGQTQGGKRWQRALLADSVPDYIEIQGGIPQTQMAAVPMPPRAVWEWMEAYGAMSLPSGEVLNGWNCAVTATGKEAERLVPEAWLERTLADTLSLALKPAEVVVKGSGFAALEELRRGAKLAPQLDFGETGEEQKEWRDLLEQGTMDDTPPKSYMVQDEWFELLKKAKTPNWKIHMHLAVNLYYRRDYKAAADECAKSLALARNAWNLFVDGHVKGARGDLTGAAKSMREGLSKRRQAYTLFKETALMLLKAGENQAVLDEFKASAGESYVNATYLTTLKATAIARLGGLEEAEKIILGPDGKGIDICGVREGENSVTELYVFIQREKAKRAGKVYDEYAPIPWTLNFRMADPADSRKDTSVFKFKRPPLEDIVMPPDEFMRAMETPTNAKAWADYKKVNPAPFWLAGEERRYAVRRNILPVRWFEKGVVFGRPFEAEVRPGEWFMFQTCVASEKACLLEWCADVECANATLDYITPQQCAVAADGVKPLWLCVSVPLSAGEGEVVAGKVTVKDVATGESRGLPFRLVVKGAPLADGGVHDSWRLARLKWLNSNIAVGEVPTKPFTDVKVDESARQISILGRTLTLGGDGLPSAYDSYFNGSNTRITDTAKTYLSGPMRFTFGRKPLTSEFAFTRKACGVAEWKAVTTYDDIVQTVTGSLAFDGLAQISVSLAARGADVSLKDGAALSVPVRKETSAYAMGLGRVGGRFDGSLDWKWSVADKCQDSFWMGDVNCGMYIRLRGANYRRPMPVQRYRFRPLRLPATWGSGGVTVRTQSETCEFHAFSGEQTLTREPSVYAFDLYLTPLKPVDMHKHFSDRHTQYTQRHEDTMREDRSFGSTIINLHHNTLWNPHINYPFNDQGEPYLRLFTAKAHNMGMRAKVYYTTRELTQNLPEFFPLLSLDGEIILPSKEVKIPSWMTPHAWLTEHAGIENIVPTWKETVKFDEFKPTLTLSVATIPSERFNNYYLEGLNRLVREDGIDGLYIDDTSLDRDAFMRARRILDADGNTGRRIDLHGGNAYPGVKNSCALFYMEIFPFLDRLWFGEGFVYENQPDYWLVEASGIPFGLTGEILKKEVKGVQDGGNIHCGMLFAMTQRWRLCGDPRPQWSFFTRENLADAEYIGYWDPANPVRVETSDPPHTYASVFRFKDGKTVIAFANTADNPLTVRLKLNDNDNGRWDVPAIAGFQNADAYRPGDELTVPARKGNIFVVRP